MDDFWEYLITPRFSWATFITIAIVIGYCWAFVMIVLMLI